MLSHIIKLLQIASNASNKKETLAIKKLVSITQKNIPNRYLYPVVIVLFLRLWRSKHTIFNLSLFRSIFPFTPWSRNVSYIHNIRNNIFDGDCTFFCFNAVFFSNSISLDSLRNETKE